MISSDKGVIRINGCPMSVLTDALGLIYAVDMALKKNPELYHSYKEGLKRLASDDMQDYIADFKQFDSEEELKKYMANMKSGEGKRGTFEDMFGDLFS